MNAQIDIADSHVELLQTPNPFSPARIATGG
jgi:hypothetical protein